MKRLLLAFAFLVAGIGAAAAACTSPAVMKDNASTTFNMSLATVPDGNCGSNVALPTWAGGTLGAMANYGTSPGAVLVPGVNAFITNTPTVSVPTWAGGTLGAMANYGTSPGAVLVPGTNAFITNIPAVTQSSGPWTQNVTQFGGSNVATGTGAGGAGIPRFTISNDSSLAANQSVNVNQVAGAAPSATNPIWTAGAQATVSAGNTINAVTANTTGTNVPTTGFGSVLVNINCSVNCTGGTTVTLKGADVVGTFTATGMIKTDSGTPAGATSPSMVTNVVNQSGQAYFCAPNPGYANMRADVSSYSAGTISVTITPFNSFTCDYAQVVNSTALGQTTMAASSPVTLASDQSAVAVKAASGAFASGALASGSVASGALASGSIAAGAFASGAVPSGAYSSGALASGAVVDITNFTGSTGSAPPSKAAYLGANASGATGGQVRGLINCDNHVFKHITTATDTLAVQGVASQTIYVCGAGGNAAGTATWFLENTASANANCSSTNTQITGVATMAANGVSGFYNPIWGGLKNTSGNGLCINSTGTGGVDVDIWYTQF